MSTELYLPSSLPFPIKILKIPPKPPAEILRGANLLTYSYIHHDQPTADEPEPEPEVRYGTWDSPIEGVIDKWNIRPGDTISVKHARGKPVLLVNEPCKHGMQLGGLCCLCGKDMTEFDYTGFSDASRASIQMTHSANGPTVSLEEARRIEQETATHLLKSRKLTLIVDLDQTIVHATVDPTVGDWISEGEAWEARQTKRRTELQAKVKAKAKAGAETNGDVTENGATHIANGDGKETDSQLDFEPDPNDEVNPNWEALKDVKKFRLGPDAFLPPTGIRPSGSRKGKERAIENEGCLYYVKPRPRWKEFLSHVSTKYEMHVYTMGTRAYAEEVCAAIDPGGVFFGGRILSRDESGSLTQKSLQRLFPCDTSMVVIIDDRADVWEWSPNLIKVIPYDFFVGIGDINSTFLPKVDPLTPSVPPQSSPLSTNPPTPSPPPLSPDTLTPTPSTSEISSKTAIHEASPTLVESDDEELEKSTMITRNSIALEAQVEERPLAKKQEELEEQEQKEEAQSQSSDATRPDGNESESAQAKADVTPQPAPHKHHAKALLRNDDCELLRVQSLLNQVHQTFYDAYELSQALKGPSSPVTKKGKRRPSVVDEDAPLFDVKAIIPTIRQMTFAGFRIVFSSVIPLDVPPETTDIWRTAVAFGAECYKELNPRITHVVANKRGTAKVDQARRLQRTTNPSIKIVWLAWFNDSLALWKRQDETPYLLDDPPQRSTTPPSAPTHGPGSGFGSTANGGGDGNEDVKSSDDVDDVDGHAISSDPEPDADDWDFDPHNPPPTSAARTLDLSRGDTEATGTGTSTPIPEAALKELEGTEELNIDIDWTLMNDEFDAWMEGDSSDEEEGGGEGNLKPAGSGNAAPKNMELSEDEWTDETNSIISTPRSKRKRLRSLTPSEANSAVSSTGDPSLRSPLAKRKKLSADRFGAGSKLRESHTIPAPNFTASARSSRAGSLVPSENGSAAGSKPGTPRKEWKGSSGEDEDDGDDGSDEAFDIEDDFLAREMEEELG